MSESVDAIIQSSSPLNLFDHITLARATTGETQYMCFYINVKSLTEGLPSIKFWLDRDTLSDQHEFSWSLDNAALAPVINANTILFDGVNDDVDCTNDATLWSTSLTKFSFSFWIYPTAGWDGQTRDIVNHGGASAQGFLCLIDTTTGRVRFNVKNAANGSNNAQIDSLVLNTWNFVTCVYDNSLGSANVKIYVNAVVGGTTANLTEAINQSVTLTLGNTTTDFKGNMKQFKFWKTTALSQTQISNLYAGNDSLVTTPSYDLPMDEGEGNPVDIISGSKVGTLTNGALWDNTIKTIRPSPHKYIYAPFGSFNGTSDKVDDPDDPKYDNPQFAVAAWFNTKKADYTTNGFIVNKGHLSTETAGANLSFGIWMNSAEKIVGGFETSAGTDNFVTSPLSYNDGKWHHVLLKYNAVTLRLFIDGMEVANLGTTSVPDTNSAVMRIGGHSGAADQFFEGYIDEVRIWSSSITSRQVADYYTFGTIPNSGNVVYTNKFGTDNGSILAQELANITTEPLLASWNKQDTEPEDLNLYISNLAKASVAYSSYLPIFVRRVMLASPTTQSLGAQGIFKLKGLLRRSNTDQGGNDGGSGTPQDVENIRLGFVGDSDCKSMFSQVLDAMDARNVEWKIFLGDQNYVSGTTCWFDAVGSITNVLITIGNHDEDSGKRSTWTSRFSIPNGYYRRDIENIAIIVMDSESTFSTGSPQYTFINNELKKASEDNNIDWIIVTCHRPFITADSTHPPNEGNKADIYMPLFTKYHVDLVLQGHNHNYQRSKLLKDNTADHENPTVVTSGSTFTKGDGFVVVTCGLGGHDSGGALYPLDNTPSWQQYQQRSENGYCDVDFTGTNNSTLTGKLITIDGDTLDTFTIS